MGDGVSAADTGEAGRLLGQAESLRREVARQRGQLRASWLKGTQDVQRAKAALWALTTEIAQLTAALKQNIRDFGVPPDEDYAQTLHEELPRPTADASLQLDSRGQWSLKPQVKEQFTHTLALASEKLTEAKTKTFGWRARNEGAILLAKYLAWLQRLGELRALLDAAHKQALGDRARTSAAGRAAAEEALGPAQAAAVQALTGLPAPLQPWDSPAWADRGIVAGDLGQVYAGSLVPLDDPDLGDNAAFASAARLPFFLPMRGNLEIVYSGDAREQALSFARSLLLRQLAATSPGEMQLCFFDPVGLGQSAADFLGLAEYAPELISGKAWSSSADLAARLAEQTAHIELVIQKYLRTTYQSIEEFNAAAGEIAEPYRHLVVFDFPTAFSEETIGRLKSILQNGPRCGVYTLLLTSTSVAPGYGVDLSQVAGQGRRINFGAKFASEYPGYTLQTWLEPERETAARADVAARVIDTVGRRVVGRAEAAVTFEKAFGLYTDIARRGIRPELSPASAATSVGDETTWWREDSIRGLFAPVGQKGARDPAIVTFDSGDHCGALLVGRPGSGKSTLLHALIGGMTTLYSPLELELYLIDFKEGVEFKAYATEGLPHARMVAIESDREFGLSVLQSLEAEMSRRGELLRATGGRHAGLQALRETSGQALPRVLLVFDEFQVLFARNDKLGLAAAGLLETIIRQGRGFGIHVLLGSQSLSGLDALGAHVPQLLPTRILLPATDADARRVLGEGNDAGQYLVRHGEGILNAAGGAVEANERFKGALLTEGDRVIRLRALRAKADAAGFARRPTVFEGNASVPLDAVDPATFLEQVRRSGSAPLRLRAGAPMTVAAAVDIDLRRESGGNVLAVIRDGDDPPGQGLAYGLLAAAVASAAASPARLDVIDFMPIDDGLDAVFEPLLDAGRVTLRRRRAFGPLIGELRKDVRRRIEDDDALAPARLAFLFGIHRARELDAEIGGIDADPDLAEALEEVMRDGPEVGVHLWMWSETVGGAARRLSSRMMRECGWRIAGKMSPDDSLSLLGSEQAAEIRDRQLLLCNDDYGIAIRAMTFGVPRRDWLTSVLAH
ncbi:MAG TPA: FtsK/SpoIIIE domain-containing protein [Trebonia sp.]|nr:FtsK/SpoIIIE domain-containing protein [Trebonia sp.]